MPVKKKVKVNIYKPTLPNSPKACRLAPLAAFAKDDAPTLVSYQ